jgi:hypothetical protein
MHFRCQLGRSRAKTSQIIIPQYFADQASLPKNGVEAGSRAPEFRQRVEELPLFDIPLASPMLLRQIELCCY